MDRVEPLGEQERYRCGECGNLTRFDVVESTRARRFYHFSLGGELSVEEEEVLAREVELVSCRWCGSSRTVERVSLLSEGPAQGAQGGGGA
jgi:hypothetical protein